MGDEEKEESETTAENRKRLIAAKEQLASLQSMGDKLKAVFPDFADKVADAKAAIAELQKTLSEGKPIDTRLKAAEARLKKAERNLETKTEQRTKAKLEQAETNRKVAEFTDGEATAQEAVDDIRHEIGTLRRESAFQFDGQPAATVEPALAKDTAEALRTVLNTIHKDTLSAACAERKLDPETLVEALTKLLAATPAGNMEARNESSSSKGHDKPKENEKEKSKAIEVDDEMGLDFNDIDDFDFDEADLSTDLPIFVEQGFEAQEGEEASATRIRLKVWANKLGESCRKQDQHIRKRMGPLNKFRKDPKGGTTTGA